MDECRKKLNLSQQVQCRCALFFCLRHRYPESHNCTYNRRKDWDEKLNKENPKIEAEKIKKI